MKSEVIENVGLDVSKLNDEGAEQILMKQLDPAGIRLIPAGQDSPADEDATRRPSGTQTYGYIRWRFAAS
jgi:hypothetical protein